MRFSVHLRRALIPVVSVAILLPVPGAAARPELRSLTGTNRVSASRSSWMPVSLPRPVTISTHPFNDPAIKISKGGPVASVILRQDIREGIEVIATTADQCGRACNEPGFSVFSVYVPRAERATRRVTLPAGRYQLYVIANRGPTKATIELPGLSGSEHFAPRMPAEIRSKPIESSTPNTFEAQVDHTLSRRGISLVAFEVDTQAFVAGNFSTCIEPSDAELPEAADGPTCEGGRTAGAAAYVDHSLREGRRFVLSTGLLGPGSWEHQLKFRSASVIRSLHAWQYVLTYETSDRGSDWQYMLAFSI